MILIVAFSEEKDYQFITLSHSHKLLVISFEIMVTFHVLIHINLCMMSLIRTWQP